MEQLNNTTICRKNKHLNYEERIKLEALYKLGLKPASIGKQLGDRNRRTIEREIAKGMVTQLTTQLISYEIYSAEVGQQIYDRNATNKGPALKIGKDHKLVEYLEKSIGKEKKSPYAALQNIKNCELKFDTTLCVKTLYNYIDSNLFLNISNKDLLVKKDGKKRDYHKIRQAITNVKGTSISDRPIEIDNREEFGHWEMDTVVGKQGSKTVLLVLSERMTRQELIFKIKSKSQSEVVRIINKLERKYGKEFKDKFRSITTDNGCEFLNFEGIEKSILNKSNRTKMFYAHPYSSWERGTNENINKMIRRFIPKGIDISIFTEKDIIRIQNWINNYPRLVLGGASSNMITKNYMVS